MSIKTNSILNTIKTLMMLIFPLITAPYALRVLQVANIGKFQYSYSIINFFILFAGLGISRYASREGAYKRDNKQEINLFASQMFTLNLISTIVIYIILFVSLIFIDVLHPYFIIILILSINIIGTTMGMEWINIAYEEYTFITIRSILVQFVSMILLFVFVKTEHDLLKYVCISVFSNIGANILNFFHVRKHVKIKINFKGLMIHFIPVMLLFASSIASQIYVNSDTVMLGLFCGDKNVGIYSVATRIYSIMQQILAASITVLLPRLSNCLANDNKNVFKTNVKNCFDFIATLLFPASLGLFLLAPDVIQIFGGETYISSVLPLRILCFSLLFSVFGIFFTNTMLLPMKKEKKITIIMCISALVNIILNLVFIPFLQEMGAAITTVISEIIVLVLQLVAVRKYSIIKFNLKYWIGIVIGCVTIVMAVLLCNLINDFVLRIILSILSSIFLYGIILVMFKNPLALYVIKMIKNVTHKISK